MDTKEKYILSPLSNEHPLNSSILIIYKMY